MSYSKSISKSVREWEEELKEPHKFKCIMCGNKFRTQEELSKHQHLFCTGGW